MIHHRPSRRDFLSSAIRHGAAACGAASLIGGCSQHRSASANSSGGRSTQHSFRLGLDTYMLHHALTAKNPADRLDLYRVIDQLDEIGLTGVQIDPSHFHLVPGDDAAALDRLEAIVKPRGCYVEFGMGGWDPARLETRVRLTQRFGGKALRTFCGSEKNTQEELASFIRWAPPALREAAERTEDCSVAIAVENHGDFTSGQLEELILAVNHPRVGVCLDTGNSLFRKEDPLHCAKVLAPHARSMHLKDWFMSFRPDGAPDWREAALGHGEVPVAEILRIVARYHPDLYIALESPAKPAGAAAQTTRHEWDHLVATARQARKILENL